MLIQGRLLALAVIAALGGAAAAAEQQQKSIHHVPLRRLEGQVSKLVGQPQP